MKKIVTAALTGLISAAAFAGMNNVTVAFSTQGPDKYADGTTVVDGECYALVYTPNGGTFEGVNPDGTIVGNAEIVLVAPDAKDGKCPKILFQIDEEVVAEKYSGGSWSVCLLDTRVFKIDAETGAVVLDADGNKVVASKGDAGKVNGYSVVGTASTGERESISAGEGVAMSEANLAKPVIKEVKLVNDKVKITVETSRAAPQVSLEEGTDPSATVSVGEVEPADNTSVGSGEVIIYRDVLKDGDGNKAASGFFKVGY